jgi:hypothetical protein
MKESDMQPVVLPHLDILLAVMRNIYLHHFKTLLI